MYLSVLWLPNYPNKSVMNHALKIPGLYLLSINFPLFFPGDFAILLNSGLSYKLAMLANFLSACLCYVGLVIGLVLGYATHAVKYIYGIAGGMFIYIALVDMVSVMCTTL